MAPIKRAHQELLGEINESSEDHEEEVVSPTSKQRTSHSTATGRSTLYESDNESDTDDDDALGPPIWSNREDAIIVSKEKVMGHVTAIAIALQGRGVAHCTKSSSACSSSSTTTTFPVLYSGHIDGTVCKWNLQTNEMIWKRKIFESPIEAGEPYDGLQKFGIRGITIRESTSDVLTRNLVYVWSHDSDSGDGDGPHSVNF